MNIQISNSKGRKDAEIIEELKIIMQKMISENYQQQKCIDRLKTKLMLKEIKKTDEKSSLLDYLLKENGELKKNIKNYEKKSDKMFDYLTNSTNKIDVNRNYPPIMSVSSPPLPIPPPLIKNSFKAKVKNVIKDKNCVSYSDVLDELKLRLKKRNIL